MPTELPVIRYECEPGCGACCAWPIIEISELDFAREPRLKAAARPLKMHELERYDGEDEETGESLGPLVPGWEAGGLLACGKDWPCPMLAADKSCSIYSTRPNVCVGFRAGSGMCQESRAGYGLPPLQPLDPAARPG